MVMAKFCYFCLDVERRVFEFMKSDFKQFIEKIFLENSFHQILYEKFYICCECMAHLEKSYKFVQKALTAQNALTELWQLTSEITLDDINAIDRKKLGLITNLSRHGPFIISCFTKDGKEGEDSFLTVNDDEKTCELRKNEQDFTNKPLLIRNANEKELKIDELYKNEKERKDVFLTVNDEKAPSETDKLHHKELAPLDELYEDEKELVNEETVLEAYDDNNKGPAVIDELYESEIIVEIEESDVFDPFDNIEVKLEANEIKNKSNLTTDTASSPDVAVNKLKKTLETEHNTTIITIDDTVSESGSNNTVTNQLNLNKTKMDKIAKQIAEDPDFTPNLIHKLRPKSKPKETDSDCPLQKKHKKRLQPKDYKPSTFMLSLSSVANKRRRRNKEKYVFSDDSDDSDDGSNKNSTKNDEEFKPAVPDSSDDVSGDSDYDRYDDAGRRLKKPDDRIYPMPCDHCNAEIPEKRVHYKHYLIAHPHIEYPYRRKSANLLCQFCGRVSRKRQLHEAHLLTHDAESEFPCTKCDKKFKNKVRLQRHLNYTHTDVLLECDYCGKKMKVRSDLVLHIRTHTGEKPFKCHICGAGFAHKGNVGIHIRSVHQGLTQSKKQDKKINTKKVKNRKKLNHSNSAQKSDEPLVKKRKVTKAKPEKKKKKSK